MTVIARRVSIDVLFLVADAHNIRPNHSMLPVRLRAGRGCCSQDAHAGADHARIP
jgi:hypothetical protein